MLKKLPVLSSGRIAILILLYSTCNNISRGCLLVVGTTGTATAFLLDPLVMIMVPGVTVISVQGLEGHGIVVLFGLLNPPLPHLFSRCSILNSEVSASG